jgi:hypothetical protein
MEFSLVFSIYSNEKFQDDWPKQIQTYSDRRGLKTHEISRSIRLIST